MFHLSRPPYLRRFIAIAIVVAATAVELLPPATEPLAVAVFDIAAGVEINEADVRWVDAPSGLFPTVDFPATLTGAVAAGAPITGHNLTRRATRFPEDWLLIELEVPPDTRDGASIVAVVATEGTTRALSGVVARNPTPSDFGGSSSLVAFSPQDAVAVASGLMAGEVSVLLGS